MPNTVPPIVTCSQALEYRNELLKRVRICFPFKFLAASFGRLWGAYAPAGLLALMHVAISFSVVGHVLEVAVSAGSQSELPDDALPVP